MRPSAIDMTRLIPALGGVLLFVVVSAAAAMPAPAQDDRSGPAATAEAPSATDVLLALRGVDVPLEGLQVRTTVMDASDAVGSALVELGDGTLADVHVVATAEGWATRDIFFVAGNAEAYRSWSSSWRNRVESAQRFLASGPVDERRRRAQELAPLVWFEDEEESARLWGLNPVTYRLMQTLKMMPSLGGPIGGSGSQGNPAPRRQ